MNDTAILLVGHGSRNREGNQEILHFAAQWRDRHPGWRIETCFIEHAEVLLDAGLDRPADLQKQIGKIAAQQGILGVEFQRPAEFRGVREAGGQFFAR